MFAVIAAISLFFTLITFNKTILTITVFLILIAYLMTILRNKQYREYEYIFTNGNLQIDVIYNKQKEKLY
ncbi:hypothetical protein PL321_02655 [Caloramator sp. mosi_1]|uniref:hypothetical protein n=1 Tax=Caloramator sp. mosi_1 TaxID=3023090 RepID=UPI002362A133|nr:hypothetical protein [Caloramator sp. mosi_1]WDC84624.1 hypothetical protein PL321_02655 [Caloramator sp. mosi_1]